MTFLPASCMLFADETCSKPYTLWTEEDVDYILNRSPWSQVMTLSAIVRDVTAGTGGDRAGRNPRTIIDAPRGYGISKSSGVSGEKELYYKYTVRLFSALPVRQAYVRMLQIANHYSELPPSRRLALDARTAPALTLDVSRDIIVSIEFDSNDRQMALEVDRQLRVAQSEQLKQQVYLISEHFNRLELKDYIRPDPDGTGAKFIFPRTIDGEPIVGKNDRELAFEFYMPGVGHKVYVIWKVQELECYGSRWF